jgi:hypothetical protein
MCDLRLHRCPVSEPLVLVCCIAVCVWATAGAGAGGLCGSSRVAPHCDDPLLAAPHWFLQVACNNTAGWSAAATCGPAQPVGPPGPPTTVVAVAGNASATLTWDAPADTSTAGGAPVANYTVVVLPSNGTAPAPLVVSVSTATIAGLVNGAQYVFNVSAANEAGQVRLRTAECTHAPCDKRLVERGGGEGQWFAARGCVRFCGVGGQRCAGPACVLQPCGATRWARDGSRARASAYANGKGVGRDPHVAVAVALWGLCPSSGVHRGVRLPRKCHPGEHHGAGAAVRLCHSAPLCRRAWCPV